MKNANTTVPFVSTSKCRLKLVVPTAAAFPDYSIPISAVYWGQNHGTCPNLKVSYRSKFVFVLSGSTYH